MYNVKSVLFSEKRKEGSGHGCSGRRCFKNEKAASCGSMEFTVLRSGMDFKIRCNGCGREVMVPRLKCEKNIKKIIRKEEEDTL